MACSSGLSDTLENVHLTEDEYSCVSDSEGHDEYYDVEIVEPDGFYLANTMYELNYKIQHFASYWMSLYSNCCIQRNEALSLIRLDATTEAIKVLEDWPQTVGCPKLPQVLEDSAGRRQRKKPRCEQVDPSSLIQEMKNKLQLKIDNHFDVPIDCPSSDDLTLEAYEHKIKECESCFQTVENYHLKNAFAYGHWLNRASERFQRDKKDGRVKARSYDAWVDAKCFVKSRRARQLRSLSKNLAP